MFFKQIAVCKGKNARFCARTQKKLVKVAPKKNAKPRQEKNAKSGKKRMRSHRQKK